MTKRQKRELLIKRCVILFSLLAIVICLFSRAANTNKTRYYAEAICEQEGGELHFYFGNQEFVWTLDAGDKIPSEKICVLVMESNGTDSYADDEIISYK